jgi:myo-inositol 2-dehydrogenase/D-chiro-inositol 1-dehydrogenase
MKECLSEHKVGLVTATWLGVMPPTPWWRVKARSGGQLAEQATHIVDVLLYLFGDIRSVFSTARKGLIVGVPNYDVEDASASVFTFESGLLASVTCGCFLDGSKVDSKIGFEIFMDGARADYSWDSSANWGSRQMSSTARFGNDFHYPALQTFIEALRTKDPSKIRSTYSDGVKTFRATFAANLSMESHREVLLSEI